MTRIVARTCTEVLPRGRRRGPEAGSTPLSAFRSEPAYVLLGDPGMGKTTAFKRECRELGATAHFVDARDFLTFELSTRPGWREKTLYIDGLDEVRAGSTDAPTPLDAIRRRLDVLGRPPFRISCREADWLGDTERTRLDAVAPGGEVAVLRLDPLTESNIEQVLSDHPKVEEPHVFIRESQARGVHGLLTNPQTLSMLADVVGSEEAWPRSKLETFEMACLQMVTEHNDEHYFETQPPTRNQLLDAAGYLCAGQLLTGAAGFSLNPGRAAADYIALADCDYAVPSALRPALSTKAFKAVGERRFVPVHRHVAEFLAARHLAGLIAKGLPARRVLALISGADGVVVTEMRGVSGWLAAQSGDARRLLIERDPIGVSLYGDIRHFSPREKSRLLRVLGRREVLTTLWRETPWFEMGPTSAALTSPDMEPVISDILTERSRDPEHQGLIQFVLTLVGQGSPLPSLGLPLLDIARDETWPPRVRSFALDGFLHATAGGEGHTTELKELLAGIHAGTVPDPNNQMRGALLARLYPKEIPPSSIWDYPTEGGDRDLMGHYWSFWEHDFLNKSSDHDRAELLDQLSERRSDVLPALESHNAESLPLRLLAEGLHVHGDDLATARLYNWLTGVAPPVWQNADRQDHSLRRVRSWLERRPEVQKAVILEGLSRCPDSDRYYDEAHEVWGALLGSSPPSDFGPWCLAQADELAPVHTKASADLFRKAFREWTGQGGDGPPSLAVLEESARGHPVLERDLSLLLQSAANSETAARRATVERSQEEQREARQREEEIAYVRSNVEALRENRAEVSLVDGLGRVYFLFQPARSGLVSSAERLSAFLGGEEGLVEAAQAGLRGTLWRGDVPELEEVIRLHEESSRHGLGFAYLAGLDLLERDEPSGLHELNESQVRKGLAFYYCTHAGFRETPAWVVGWTERFPETVAALAARCLLSAIRHGDGYSRALETIRGLDSHPALKHETVLNLLAKFPPRADLQKLETLDSLLWHALAYPDRSSLLDVIAAKLSLKSIGVAQRVRWLAAGVVASPETWGEGLERFVSKGERRVRWLAAFFASRDSSFPLPFPNHERSALVLQALIALMGRSFAPTGGAGRVTLGMTASAHISRLIRQLASLPGEDALQALDSLVSDSDLVHWRDELVRARDDQRVAYRDASYRHPELGHLHRAFNDREPANAGDLAALVHDRLSAVAADLRTRNTDDWRQYWNEDAYGRPRKPKHEHSCRDALLSRLRPTLPADVDAQPEGQYAGDKRADIRIAYGACNVPVEIKKDRNPRLWSALQSQLIERYTRGTERGGYGIYLVFWFGQGGMPAPPTGTRPTTPAELQERLEGTLTAEEALKIAVLVIDVSPVI